ncbi:hypothetical protein ACIGKR_11940 [Rhodococcus qingshengii]|uniref:hypothetical protein n=1 Tax=Rhodococcus qingshengii TaxID=334542 RepID=UPI0037CAECC8
MKPAIVTISTIAALALAAAGCSSSEERKTFTTRGQAVTSMALVSPNGQDCGRLRAKDEVRVTDGSGGLISLATLGKPAAKDSVMSGGRMLVECTFTFTLKDVPAGERFYGVTIGGAEVKTYSEDEIRKGVYYFPK